MQNYDLRRGDLLRLRHRGRGVDYVHIPPWRKSQQELKMTMDWVKISLSEHMTIVGKVPYPCSCEWVLYRHLASEDIADRWVMVRADDVTLAGTSWQHCIGQTVSMKSDPTAIGVILDKERGGMPQRVKILKLDKVLRFVSFNEMEIMVPEPPGF